MYFLKDPTAPRSLMIVDVTDTTVTLSWISPDPPNGMITQYQVQYRRTNSGGSFGNNQVTTDLTYTVTGLTTGTLYGFRVRAFTAVGNGPPSDVATAFVGELQYVLLLYIIASDFNLFKNSLPETNEI